MNSPSEIFTRPNSDPHPPSDPGQSYLTEMPPEVIVMLLEGIDPLYRFMLYLTCSHLSAFDDKNRRPSNYLDLVRVKAIENSDVNVLVFLFDKCGMKTHRKYMIVHLDVNKLDVIKLYMDRTDHEMVESRINDGMLMDRITKESENEECVRYTVDIILPSVCDKEEVGTCMDKIKILLYDNPDPMMLEKMFGDSSREDTIRIADSYIAMSSTQDIIGFRLFRDLFQRGWFDKIPNVLRSIVKAKFNSYCTGVIDNTDIIDICLANRVLDESLMLYIGRIALFRGSVRGVRYCIENKIPFSVCSVNEAGLYNGLKNKGIEVRNYWAFSPLKTIIAHHNMPKKDRLWFINFFIEHGAKVQPDIFQYTNESLDIESVKLLISIGGNPRLGTILMAKVTDPKQRAELVKLGFPSLEETIIESESPPSH